MQREKEALEQIKLLEQGMQKQREEGREMDIGKEARAWAFSACAYELMGQDGESAHYGKTVFDALVANVQDGAGEFVEEFQTG